MQYKILYIFTIFFSFYFFPGVCFSYFLLGVHQFLFLTAGSKCQQVKVFFLFMRDSSLFLITHSVTLPPSSSPFATTTGKTTPTTATTTHHAAAFPKEAGDSERGTGPDRPPPVGEQGSPDSEPISVEMEGKGAGHLSLLNSGNALLGPDRLSVN